MCGIHTAVALTAAQGFPPAIQDIVATMNTELDSIQERNDLPSDMGQWATVLTVRLQCNFDTFSTATPYVITRSRAMLLELHPGDGELTSRLGDEVEVAKQRSSHLNRLWLKFKMLYDGYLLHLEKADRDVIEKAYLELEQACKDAAQRAADVVAGNARWKACFELVLTESGHNGYMETINRRRAWTIEAFPREISRIVEELHLLRQERARLSQETSTRWDNQLSGWFTHAGDQIPVVEFCTALVWYMDVVKQLTTYAEKQKDFLAKLNGFMRLAKFNTTTLNRPREGHVPVQDIRQAFEQFNHQWAKARRVAELCSPLIATLEQHVATLKATSDRV